MNGLIKNMLLPLLVVSVLGCRKEKTDVVLPEGEGSCEVTFKVNPDYTLHQVVLTRAGEEDALSEYSVRLENTKAEVLREWKHDELPRLIKVVPGAYKLVAWQGADTIYPAFEKPYYYGETKITLKEGDNLDTVVNVGLAAVKVAVNFDESFAFEYEDYFVEVKTTGDSLRFLKDETRTGYFKPGNLRLRFGLKRRGEDVYREFYPEAIGRVEAKTFCKMKLSADCKNGVLQGISITTDASTINMPVNEELPVWFLPKGAPKVTLSGVETGGTLETTEGVSRSATVLVSSAGGLTELKVKTLSDTLIARGWPAEVDLMSATEEQKAVLRASGLQWSEELDKNKEVKSLVWVKFDQVVRDLNTASGKTSETRFTVMTKDKFNQEGNEVNFGVQVAPPVFEFVGAVGEGNVWAKRAVYGVKYVSERETPVVECQGNDGVWRTLETTRTASESEENVYECVGTGLASNTEYAYRVRLGGHVLDAGRFKTEEELQVPNAEFNDWHSTERSYKHAFLTQKVTTWHPWLAGETDIWWATRNPASTSQKAGYTNVYCANNGTTQVDINGDKAVQIMTTAWGGWNTSLVNGGGTKKNITAGLLYLGDYSFVTNGDDYLQSEVINEGKGFASRPAALHFIYQYAPIKSESFKVCIVLQNRGNGGVVELGRAEWIDGNSVKNMTDKRLEITYNKENEHLRATHICLMFMSSTAENPATTNSGTGTLHYGSKLIVDKIHLEY